jgi:hypothetical protein
MDESVPRAAQQFGPVGANRHVVDQSAIARQPVDLLAFGDVPVVSRAFHAGRQQTFSVGGQRHASRVMALGTEAADLANLRRRLLLNAFDLRQRHFPARQRRLVDVQLQPLWSPLQR